MSLPMACTATHVHSMISDMTQRTNIFAMSAGTGIPSRKSTTIVSKDNGLNSKPLHDHFEASKASWAYGALSLPESTDITTLCPISDLKVKHLLRLSAKNYHTVTTFSS